MCNALVGSPLSGTQTVKLKILAFAYMFPPDAGSGTYRTLYFANQWASQGDAVTVITVDERCFLPGTDIDRRLCDEVHPSIKVVRATASRPLQKALELRDAVRRILRRPRPGNSSRTTSDSAGPAHRPGVVSLIKDTMTDILACPDEHIGWIPDAVRRALHIVRANEADCIYATGGPWSCLVAALRLHRLSGLPLVLDFRDPWVGNPHFLRRSPLCRWRQRRLERSCVAASRFIIANTEQLRQDLVRRYPSVPPDRFVTVTNGFEEIRQGVSATGSQFTMVHTGNFYGSRTPSNLLKAVRELVTSDAIPASALRLRFAGDIGSGDQAVESELKSDVVRSVLEVSPRIPHDEALALQQQASVLLLVQTGYVLQVPRKLYEYLSVGRPILAVTEPHSATAGIIRELQAGYVVDDSVESIRSGISGLYRDWQAGRRCTIDIKALAAYQNRHLAARLHQVLVACCKRDSASPTPSLSSRLPATGGQADRKI